MEIKLNVRQKLVFAIMGLGVFLFSATLVIVYRGYKNFLIDRSSEDLVVVAQFVSARFQDDILDIKNQLAFVAFHNQDLRNAVARANALYGGVSDEEALKRMQEKDVSWDKGAWEKVKDALLGSPASFVLKDLGLSHSGLGAEIFITDIKGALVATTQKTSDYYQADEEWWQQIYAGGVKAHYLSGVEYDQSAGTYSFSLACPVVDARNTMIGVMKAVIKKDMLFDSVFSVYLGKGSRAGVLSSQGGRIFTFGDSPRHAAAGFSKILFDFLVLRQGRGDKIVVFPNKKKYIVGFTKIEDPSFGKGGSWYFYCMRDLGEVLVSLRPMALRFFLIWIAVMGFLYGATFVIARRFVAPITLFKRAFTQVSRGIWDRPLHVSTGDDFEEMAGDFNTMVREMRDSTISKECFSRIIQNMSDILFVVDPYGLINLVNKRTCEFLEYDEAELKGAEAIKIFSKNDRYVVSWGLKGLIEEGALRDKKIRLLAKSGREVEVFLETRSIKDVGGNLVGLICLAKDLAEITKLLDELQMSNAVIKRHEQELEKSLKELTESRDVMLSILEDSDESKKALEETFKKLKATQNELLQAEKMVSLGQIAAGVAHEINNPLFVISGEAEMLDMEEGLDPSTKESVHIIREQVTRIGGIIKRLLEFSRKKETKFTAVNIHELLEKSVELLKYQIRVLGTIEIASHFSNEAFLVSGDSNQLHEVFLNIMLNACQAMEDKGGCLTLTTFSEIIKKEKFVVAQIRDTGIGMSEETTKRIFEPFFTTKKIGTGLGLSVCYGIMENHGGMIEVESAVGAGTTFAVKIPLLKEEK
jgi:PAS domain S-box-containing protein